MENQQQSGSRIVLSVQTLMEWQLSQWQEQLVYVQHHYPHEKASIAYCQAQIDYCLSEAKQLAASESNIHSN